MEQHISNLEGLSDPKFFKQGVLSMIGIWNRVAMRSQTNSASGDQIDAGNGVTHRRTLEDGTFEWVTRQSLVDLHSMMPWGQ